MHYNPITNSRRKLQADSLSRQKCYAAHLQNLLAKESGTNAATNTITRKGAK